MIFWEYGAFQESIKRMYNNSYSKISSAKNSIPIFLLFIFINPDIQANENSALHKGVTFSRIGKYDSAAFYLKKASDHFAKSDTIKYIEALNKLGVAYMNISSFDQADSTLNLAMDIVQKKMGGSNLMLAEGLHNLSRNLGSRGKYDESIKVQQEALSMRLELLDPFDTLLASNYNMMMYSHKYSGNYKEAKRYGMLAEDIWKEKSNGVFLEAGSTYSQLGWIAQAEGEMDVALEYHLKAIDIRKKVLGNEHPILAASLNLAASTYRGLGDFDNALACATKALDIRIATLGKNHINVGVNYSTLGAIYFFLGDYHKSIEHYLQAINTWRHYKGEDHYTLVGFYTGIAAAYRRNRRYDKFEFYTKKAATLGRKLYGNKHPSLINTHILMSRYSTYLGANDKRVQYLDSALWIAETSLGKSHPTVAFLMAEIGIAYSVRGEFELSLSFATKAIEIYQQKYGHTHHKMAGLYLELAVIKSRMGELESSLQIIQKALLCLSGKSIETIDLAFNPDVHEVASKIKAASILNWKGRVSLKLFDTDTTNKILLKQALSAYGMAMSHLDDLRNESSSESTREALYDWIKEIYSGGMRAAYLLHNLTGDPIYMEEGFSICERSKAFILLRALNDTRAKKYADVPESLLQEETRLKTLSTYYKQKLWETKQGNDSIKKIIAEESLFRVSHDYDIFVKKIEREYPNYYKFKYDTEVINIDWVKAELVDSKTAFLEYFVGDENIYTFFLSKAGVEWRKSSLPSHFDELLSDFRKSTSNYEFIVKDPDLSDSLFSNSAFQLQEILLGAHLREKAEIRNLIVVPDNRLHQVNFDLLLTDSVQSRGIIDYRDLPYMIKRFNISYAYSGTVLKGIESQKLKYGEVFSGYAPNYDLTKTDTVEENVLWEVSQVSNKKERHLPGAVQEVVRISELLAGTIRIGEKATETFFKDQSGEVQVIHLAMHGLMDDENPLNSKLIFSTELDSLNDGALKVAEIYDLKLNAELVVLSACNSGYGKIQSGEGTMSLSRAFNYAGCPSVIMSLWRVPDESSSDLMFAFYERLLNGDRKSAALREAKLELLRTADDPLYAHPFFWGGFVLNGNTKPIEFGRSGYSGLLIFIFSALGLTFFSRKRLLQVF